MNTRTGTTPPNDSFIEIYKEKEKEKQSKSSDESKKDHISKQQLDKIIDNIYYKYRHDDVILHKLHQYLSQTLPNILENYKQSMITKVKNKKKEENDKNALVHSFLNSTTYYYCSITESFFSYEQNHYTPISEETIGEKIYAALTKENIVTSLKHKISLLIFKKLKEKNIFDSIPNSPTIQYVLNLFPIHSNSITKNMIKYFLTILGDSILKKNTNLHYFLSTKMKSSMRELSNECYAFFGSDHISKRFKYKFHEHTISDCRLLLQLDIANTSPKIIKENALDIMCIATHYSNRYKSGEDFLFAKSFDNDLILYTNYLKEKESVHVVVQEFMNSMLEISCDDTTSLTMKNMIFLWKRFCEQKNIPNIIFQEKLKNILSSNFTYFEESDSFTCVTSPYIPIVSDFLKFWSECTVANIEYDTEYEIEEICNMFRFWNQKTSKASLHSINETFVLKLIKHYFDDHVTVEKDKYIFGVQFTIWNKANDVINILKHMYEERTNHSDTVPDISNDCFPSTLYDVYQFYHEKVKKLPSQTNAHSFFYVVSKNYFEKLLLEKFPKAIHQNTNGTYLLEWRYLVFP